MNQTTARFPRASREDCLRSHEPMQGPYRKRSWLSASDPADRLVMRAVAYGVLALAAMWLVGWL